MIREAIAGELGIASIDQAVKESQGTTEVADDTDLEAAAKFDFLEWLKDKGLDKTLKADPKTPDIVLKKNLKRTFVVPEPL